MGGIKRASGVGAAVMAIGLMNRAVARKRRGTRRERLYAAYAQAALDPAFMADMEDVERHFGHALLDGLAEGRRHTGR